MSDYFSRGDLVTEKIKFEFEDLIFKEVFNKNGYFEKLTQFVSHLIKREVCKVRVLDSSYIQEKGEMFSLHLLMDADDLVVWLIFAFGDERDYFKEEYYCQTDDGLRLYDSLPIIRYNMKKICDEFDGENKEMLLDYGFILDIFKELLKTENAIDSHLE